MKKAFIILFLFIFTASFANGQIPESLKVLLKNPETVNTGNFFYRILTTEIENQESYNIYCEGYVDGYIYGIWRAYENIYWDTPSKITLVQITDIVKNYLEAHPETRHEYIKTLVGLALAEKFPRPEIPWMIFNPKWLKKEKEKKIKSDEKFKRL